MVRGGRVPAARSKATHGADPEAALRAPGNGAAAGGNGRAASDAAAAPPAGQQRPAGTPPEQRNGSRRALRNWRVRSRLFLLIVIPTITAVALGGLRIYSSVQSDQVYQRVEHLADLNGDITGLVQALQNERADTITFIVLGPDPANGGGRGTPAKLAQPELSLLSKDYQDSDGWAARATTLLHGVGSDYPALAQSDAASALYAIHSLPYLRAAAVHTALPALVVIQKYANVINTLLALDSQVAVGSNDGTLANTVRAASLVSAMKEESSEQQAILSSAQAPDLQSLGQWGPSEATAITNAQAQQQGDLNEFDAAASPAQLALYHNATSGTSVSNASQEEQLAISSANGSTVNAGLAVDNAVAATSYLVGSLRSVEHSLVSSIVSRSQSLRNTAITDLVIGSVLVILVLAIALLLTTIVGRSLVRPLRRLRGGALDVAGVSLPEAVRKMSETDGEGVSLDVEPIDVHSSDEIGQVARAFDQVHREALRLAATEAALRGNVNAMFVNLSRRSQSLVERQIKLIDELEQGEQDSDRLSSLFRMDHLATRMRRNSENLLVLAGHDASRHWNQPVAVVDVLRAAVSEIEQYERVTLNVQPGIAVRGQAVSDVVHLTAELVENATSFSAGETPVSIVGHLLSSGGVLLEIADQGVGMGAEELAHANWRLDNPPQVDVAVSRRMGLFVVARLAARHGIRVRLRSGPSGGLTALVWLPDETVTHEGAGSMPSAGGFDAQAAGLTEPTGWPDVERTATEQELSAARTPRFAPLLTEPGAAGAAGAAGGASPAQRRIPGAGLRPGGNRLAGAATGPLPAFRTTPQPSPRIADAEPFATSPVPGAVASSGTDLGTSPQSVFGSDQGAEPPAAGSPSSGSVWGSASQPSPGGGMSSDGAGGSGSDGSQSRWTPGSDGDIVLPPPASRGEENRLPIFESVESDWFRRGRGSVSLPGRDDRYAAVGAETNGWSSPADEGWRAAEAANSPTSAGVTTAGLPKRVPQANLVPGTAAESAAPISQRSAAATRERFASLQRGLREGRAAAASGAEPTGGEDDSSR
jgi:signal transduction histidine kinase